MERTWTYEPHVPVMGHRVSDGAEFVTVTESGVRLASREEFSRNFQAAAAHRIRNGILPPLYLRPLPGKTPDIVEALTVRAAVCGARQAARIARADGTAGVDRIAAKVLVVPRSDRWQEAVSTALAGPWCDPLWATGELSSTALDLLRAEARALHRQLVPMWRRRTRHGRVLSLDADLGGLTLHDLVAAETGYLAHTAGGVFEDERLNRVLSALDPVERQVIFAYAEGEGTTWTEAAAAAGAADPDAFGERVRRKAKRLAAEHTRRLTQRRRDLA
ncbi:hypothetical protein [Streptomyces sp. NPDC088794]|uniref:hypothetical protein n=1 Tax=Streptomyces sp. NPDC088794 TaxID=3365902 RepID=UPI0038185247